MLSGSNKSAKISVSINGLSATVANFPTLTSSVYGTGVTFTSGTLDINDATANGGVGLRISGLPLARYTIRFNNNSAGSYVDISNLDIITPIHSHKPNLYADLQNTLPVGSQGISDNRKLSPVKTDDPQKAWAQAVGITSNPTTTSTSFIPLQDMSCTIKTNGGALEISYSITANHSSSTELVGAQIYVNGTAVGQDRNIRNAVTYYATLADSIIVPVAPGVHKVDVYWNTSGATATALTNRRTLKVREI